MPRRLRRHELDRSLEGSRAALAARRGARRPGKSARYRYHQGLRQPARLRVLHDLSMRLAIAEDLMAGVDGESGGWQTVYDLERALPPVERPGAWAPPSSTRRASTSALDLSREGWESMPVSVIDDAITATCDELERVAPWAMPSAGGLDG